MATYKNGLYYLLYSIKNAEMLHVNKCFIGTLFNDITQLQQAQLVPLLTAPLLSFPGYMSSLTHTYIDINIDIHTIGISNSALKGTVFSVGSEATLNLANEGKVCMGDYNC